MNLQLLQTGATYSYKELCETLGTNTKAGDSKTAQMKEFARYFNWEHPINPKTKKPSKKFTITEIYDTPKERKDGRSNGNSTIFKNGELSDAVVYAMYQDSYSKVKGENTWHFNVMSLAEQCGLVSEYHSFIVDYPEQLEIIGMKEVSSSILSDFVTIRSQILGACRALEENGTVKGSGYDIFICSETVQEGEVRIPIYRAPSPEECDIIEQCEQETVDYFNENKTEFGYDEEIAKGIELESYSKIYATIKSPAIRSKVWQYCYDLCKGKLQRYSSHGRKLFIKADKDTIMQLGEKLSEDNIERVNSIYATRRVEQAKKSGDEMIKDVEGMLSSKSFGRVQQSREVRIKSKYGVLTLEEAKELADKKITMRNIAYTKNILNRLDSEEDKQAMRTYIDCIIFKDDLYEVARNMPKLLHVINEDADYGYAHARKQEVLGYMDDLKDSSTTVLSSNHMDLGEYTFKQIAEMVKYNSSLKTYAEYKYENGQGWVDTWLVFGEGKYIQLTTQTANQAQYLTLMIACENNSTATISHMNGKVKKELKSK